MFWTWQWHHYLYEVVVDADDKDEEDDDGEDYEDVVCCRASPESFDFLYGEFHQQT